MKLIKPSYEILPTIGNILKDIERVARTCYKSEDKISEDDSSAIKLCKMLLEKGHMAMFEHVNFTFFIETPSSAVDLLKQLKVYEYEQEYKFISISGFEVYMVSFSLRVLLKMNEKLLNSHLNCLLNKVLEKHPELSHLGVVERDDKSNEYVTLNPEISNYYPNGGYLDHIFITAKFICDRGVSHEIVRNRLSFAQESTRFCNYTKDKFGNELTFIIPSWFEGVEEVSIKEDLQIPPNIGIANNFGNYHWMKSMLRTEEFYLKLIENGWNPQQARSVLPNSLKTEIVVTASLRKWKTFFEQRCSKAAHPQMREIMIPFSQLPEFDLINS